MTVNQTFVLHATMRLAKHCFAIILSLVICSLISLSIIPLGGLGQVYASIVIIQFLLTSLILSVFFDFTNSIMKTKVGLRHLRFVILPVLISSIGGLIFYFLWIYKKISLDEDIYFMIVVIGVINGLLISLIHYLTGFLFKTKFFKSSFEWK